MHLFVYFADPHEISIKTNSEFINIADLYIKKYDNVKNIMHNLMENH